VTASLPVERLRSALSHAYTIDRELGKGGMATVYLAQDVKHERPVALKVLHPELAASLGPDRFLREIKTAAKLNHPHILGLHDSGEADGFLYYVMPYVEGESLRERLDRERQLPVDEAVHHARSIASALDYAHRQGIVHRDMKPENVMLYEGEAMVMDFGIAKAVSIAGDSITQTGMMVGTPAYVSPEQAAGETNLDGRSDQYSLACVLYEMLSGERAFSGPSPQAVMAKRFTETPRPLRAVRGSVPESVERAVTKAMSTETSARYKTAALFAQALASGSIETPTDTATVPQPTISAAKSVAVLPFVNASADPENEFFADGVAEEIINQLSKIQTLRVPSRIVSFALKGKTADLGEVGRKLHVSTVLDGTVRRMGNRVRVAAQLVNVADGYQLWHERYDRDLEDIFAIQDEISHAIAKALKVILTEDEKKAIEKTRATNMEAYEFYLRGRQFMYQLRRRSLEHARQMFNRAIEIDPEYALAHAGVADSCSLLYTYFDARESNLRQADAASAKALELEPSLAEAHVARAISNSLNNQHAEAEVHFEQAIRLDPKSYEAAYFYGRALKAQGRFAEAVKQFERATVIRPEDFTAASMQASSLKSMEMDAESEATNRRVLKLIRERLELNPDDARACNLAATTYAKLGEEEGAMEFAKKSLEIDPDDPMLLYNVACTYSMIGKVDEALTCLEQSIDRGFGHRDWIDHDSDFDSIRDLPRFKAIQRAM
jgi:serine/threonine protein kinase/tetratricopeptide (TPR) repeat protein